MPLKTGQSLLHYRIAEKIGEGGMGAVWKGIDTTLDRAVAIKVLPPAFTGDPDRLARFEREAKTLAALSHPNVASIYSLHEAPNEAGETVRFLALELVDGEDLAHRLRRGPLPVGEALELAQQIALGLEAAHEIGVIHRDLKPANVRVTPDGTAKVLDFGLAKSAGSGPMSSSSPTVVATVTSMGTVAGMLMGTAAYMSPEQARGKPVDRRTDVWAFGCLLYEMLAGRPAFDGETTTDVLAAVVRQDPDWDVLPSATPAGVRRILERCLRKEFRERLRDVGDVALLLREAALERAGDGAAGGEVPRRRVSRTRLGALAAVAVAVIALIVLAVVTRDDDGGLPDARVTSMTQLTDLPGPQYDPSLAPPGRMFLYVSRDGGDKDVFLQRVGGEKPINLTGDHAGEDFMPAISPDGERIAFRSSREGGGIFVMGATGETPTRVSDFGFDPAWSPDGRELAFTSEFVPDPYGRSSIATLHVLDLATRGQRTVVEDDAVGPAWSPSGARIAYWSVRNGLRDILTTRADGGDAVAVTDDAATDWDPRWSPDGRWLYFLSDRGGSPDLWRVAIDEPSGRTRGEPQPVTTGMTRVMQADLAAGGRVALTSATRSGEIFRVDFDPVAERVAGEPVTLHTSSNPFTQLDLHRTGGAIAFRTTVPHEHLFVMDLDGENRRRVVGDAFRNRGPSFSPDGRWIAFYSNRSGNYEIWAVRRDGTGRRRLTESGEMGMLLPVWLSNDRLLATVLGESGTLLATIDLPGGIDGVEAPVAPEPIEGSIGLTATVLSPDGRWVSGFGEHDGTRTVLLYELESGRLVVPVDDEGRPVFRASTPAWLDDRRIVFWSFERDAAYVWDLDDDAARRVDGLDTPGAFRFAADGRTLVVNRDSQESDVWLLTIAE